MTTTPLRPRSLFSLERVRSDRRITWLTIAGLLLVPLVIGGLLVWALWNPSERLGDVKAAVVNLDEPVTLNGQTVPLGRQLAAELMDGEHDGFSWTLTDKSDAADGLADGRYSAVVTIPKDFSRAATSTSSGPGGDAEQATIQVRTGDKAKITDASISRAVTSTATAVLNRQLTSTYIENVYVGFDTLHGRLGEAATGASSLASGVSQLATGTRSVGSAAGQLATGASSLAGGLSQLSDGTSSLAGGLAQLKNGTASLPAQAQQLASASGTASSTLTGATNGINAAFAQYCSPPADPALADLCTALGAQLKGLNTADAYAKGAASGSEQLAAGLPAVTGAIAQSASGASQLASGASQSASGASQLASGASQLSAGIPALTSGADKAASGASSLASGLKEAAAQVPASSSAERASLAKVAAQPIVEKSAGTSGFGSSGVPLFASVALWLGAIATFLVLQAVSRRALLTARASGRIALDGVVPGLVIGAVQGVLVAAVVAPALALDGGRWAAFAAVAAAVGIAFAAVNHGLVALLGGTGRFLAMLVGVIAFASGVVSTAPAFFDAAMPWLPVSPAISALRGAAEGTTEVWRGLGGLVLWAAGGFVLALIAVARRRVIDVARLLPAE